ncbi:ABC-three component system middle component 1 [Vibrio crassostreae]|uniref:ABC-three component system middle component 1 n=1 Tax=Vibrio crassostreae TaxID=246167 RepID=UPI004068DFAB
MLNTLHKICESNNLNVVDIDIDISNMEARLAIPNEKNVNQEFYLLLECNIMSDDFVDVFLNEHIETIMNKIEKLEYSDESTSKNSTLILCCPSDSISERSLIRIEENPYFFKKNIITYSQNELTELTTKIGKSFNNEMLNSLLMSDGGDNFEKFKTASLEENSFYPLLIRIMTKLPFVHYIAQDNQLDSLDQFIKNNLSQFDNNLLSYICDDDHVFSDDLINQKISTDWNLL